MNAVRRFLSRLLVSYFAAYLSLNWLFNHLESNADVGFEPGAHLLIAAHTATWARAVVWFGKHVFGLSRLKYFAGGNSDGPYSFVQLVCFAGIAVIAAAVWSILDRRSAPDRRTSASAYVVLRYVLAATLLGYGMIKVIPTQFFGMPSLNQLVRPFGDFSRFDVLWTFMGTSPGYTIFTGMIEVTAALLLLFRRTTTLGALVAAGALLNVGALDFAYGVPEKLDVIHLFAMSMVLIAPELPRLANVLVLNRPVTPIEVAPTRAGGRRLGYATAKTAVVGYLLATSMLLPFAIRRDYPLPGPLCGIYDVVTFDANGQTLEPLTTDAVRWRRIVFVSEEVTWVQMMDDSWHFYSTKYEPTPAVVTLTAEDGRTRGTLHYEHAGAGPLLLRGSLGDAPVGASLARVDESKFRLVRSRFRWINGEP